MTWYGAIFQLEQRRHDTHVTGVTGYQGRGLGYMEGHYLLFLLRRRFETRRTVARTVSIFNTKVTKWIERGEKERRKEEDDGRCGRNKYSARIGGQGRGVSLLGQVYCSV